MATVSYEAASRTFPAAERPAVDALDLHIDDGEFVVVVGPSGCGKSTSLRMLAGLEPATSGRILIDGEDVTRVRARDRDVAMVFQSYALYPNMTAAENMAFALRNVGIPRAQIRERVAEAARILQLEDLLDRKPSRMSGGQRQRVAMGRAIVRQPKVFCMDEPLSNLDAKLRVSTRGQIAELQRRLGTTTVYVTHDQTEAMTMGDRVCVLRDGVLQQVGSPTELYERPVNAFVAGFIGSPAINFLDGVQVHERRALLAPGLRIPLRPAQVASPVTVGLRPEGLDIVGAGTAPGGDELSVVVDRLERLGSETFVFGTPEVADGVTVRGGHLVVRLDKRVQVRQGERLRLRVHPEEELVFDADGVRVPHD
ncbi:ABC transporter ATP-binding protein [Ornithinimicrobium pratense]|uniref:ABC transporter ATP-binding protein n=1 Tax=Ornithinimicrobium pratense TaxID=2593973 RepID=A0A5J6V517_9MICO|nr:ABC transporter ATP-binding protein [Ornithinimicrobium pratense]QFG69080.1 ABC transporter ATP-binding protein [Ornithinimicrobium pratense]